VPNLGSLWEKVGGALETAEDSLPVTVSSLTTQGDITDGPNSTTVYDQSEETVGDGTTDADHQSVNADKVNSNLYKRYGNEIFTYELLDFARTSDLNVGTDLSDSYRRLRILVDYNSSSGTQSVGATINNDTGANYDWENGKSSVTGDSKFVLIDSPGSFSRVFGEFTFILDFPRPNGYGNGSGRDNNEVLTYATYQKSGTSINSVQLATSNGTDANIAVLGARI